MREQDRVSVRLVEKGQSVEYWSSAKNGESPAELLGRVHDHAHSFLIEILARKEEDAIDDHVHSMAMRKDIGAYFLSDCKRITEEICKILGTDWSEEKMEEMVLEHANLELSITRLANERDAISNATNKRGRSTFKGLKTIEQVMASRGRKRVIRALNERLEAWRRADAAAVIEAQKNA